MSTASAVALTTSLVRTYRNLRLGIAGTVVLLGVAVGVASAEVGVLPSISAYFYTSARGVFVGALLAAAIGILALSGRGIERVLLDAAGAVAPLIALVPTPIRAGTVPGYENACTSSSTCTPASLLPAIDTGVVSYLIVGSLAVVVSVGISLVRRRAEDMRLRAVLPSLTIAVVVLASVGLGWRFARSVFLEQAHFIAAVTFLGLIAAVAAAKVVEGRSPSLPRPIGWRRASYLIIAVAMGLDLVGIVVVVASGANIDAVPPPVFIGESIALALFAIFWVLQTIQKWDEPDPGLVA